MKKIVQLLAALALLAAGAAGRAEENINLEFGSRTATELRLPVGRSQIITTAVALEQVVTGAPDVADIKLLSAQRVLILGIKPGYTNLVFRQKGGEQVALMNVVVGYDRNGIKQKIFEAMPEENRVEVRDSNDRVILAGQASSAVSMDMALAIARSFVPQDKVVNMIQIGGGQQVMLEARIAEISRSSLKELGINTGFRSKGTSVADLAKPLPSFEGGEAASGAVASTLPYMIATYTNINAEGLLSIRLQALEKKGLAKTLAEPNLVAMSGQEANFLAGGEFPIQVAQGGTATGAITVEFKEFGVGLRFTPTVLDASRINLKLLSEVSALDFSRVVAGYPTLTTRRAGTTIEMSDGQSFAVAGLIQSDMKNAISQIPLLGNIPVLGALFRSTGFQRDETELVLIVTVHLVKPVNHRNQLYAPTDVFTPPSDIDQYLLGRLEGTPSARQSASSSARSIGSEGGGVDGSFGHQINTENRHAK